MISQLEIDWAGFGQELIWNYTELFRTIPLVKNTSTVLFL